MASQFIHLIKTIENPKPHLLMRNEHILHLPELCPATKNPKQGSTLSIAYQAGPILLELFSLDTYIQAFIGDQQVRDMEYFVQVVAEDVSDVLSQAVQVQAELHYHRLKQAQKITVWTGAGGVLGFPV